MAGWRSARVLPEAEIGMLWASLGIVIATFSATSALPEMKIRDLSEVDELRADFNRDRGVPRIILLLSPT